MQPVMTRLLYRQRLTCTSGFDWAKVSISVLSTSCCTGSYPSFILPSETAELSSQELALCLQAHADRNCTAFRVLISLLLFYHSRVGEGARNSGQLQHDMLS